MSGLAVCTAIRANYVPHARVLAQIAAHAPPRARPARRPRRRGRRSLRPARRAVRARRAGDARRRARRARRARSEGGRRRREGRRDRPPAGRRIRSRAVRRRGLARPRRSRGAVRARSAAARSRSSRTMSPRWRVRARSTTSSCSSSAGRSTAACSPCRDRPAAHAFLRWWRERLRDHCRLDTAHGMFYDQRWLDLVPGLFGDVGVLRDPAYDTAWWNVAQRSRGRLPALSLQRLRRRRAGAGDPLGARPRPRRDGRVRAAVRRLPRGARGTGAARGGGLALCLRSRGRPRRSLTAPRYARATWKPRSWSHSSASSAGSSAPPTPTGSLRRASASPATSSNATASASASSRSSSKSATASAPRPRRSRSCSRATAIRCCVRASIFRAGCTTSSSGGFIETYYVDDRPDDKEYARENTLFVLAEYLGWAEILRREVRFLDVGGRSTTRSGWSACGRCATRCRHDTLQPGAAGHATAISAPSARS